VKLLLDQNLSRNLVGRLLGPYPETTHVALLGLAMANDREVWEYARDHGHVLVSKDSDFRQLAFMYGPPPKVIWLRVGNASTAMVLRTLLDHRPAIEAFGADADEALLILPDLPTN
jgi:predicted nuclease of predicted toxin-antitoxin system